MKRIIIFLGIIISVFIGSASAQAAGTAAGATKTNKKPPISQKCPEQCMSVILCIQTAGNSEFKLFPPKSPFGECFCQDVKSYQQCLMCYSEDQVLYKTIQYVQNECNKFLGVQSSSTITTAGAVPTDSKTTNTSEAGSKNNSTSPTLNLGNDKDNKKSGNGSKIGLFIIGAVCIAGVAGFIFYTKKQKERPESMPFFGNSASSPNQYATLSASKDVSTTNLTTDYSSQYYSDKGTEAAVADNNQYYNQGYDQGYQDYNNQYPASQYTSSQYPASSYENEVVSTTVPPPTYPTNTNYESRRESMMPNSQPTTTNVTGAYICAYKYDPQLDDELALQVNDQVQIIEEYEDGWMKAVNLTTGKEGMAPRVCIKEA